MVGRPLKFTSGAILSEALEAAIAEVESEKLPMIVENIAVKLECSASTLRKYGERVDDRPEFLQPIKTMLDICQAWQVGKLYAEKGNVAGAIFALKNNYPDEYRDRQEFEQRHTSPDGTMSPKENVTKSQLDDVMAALKSKTAQEAEDAE